MARVIIKSKRNWNYSDEMGNKKNKRNRVLLGAKREPTFENKKRIIFEKELNSMSNESQWMTLEIHIAAFYYWNLMAIH